MRQTPDLLAARSFADIQTFGEYELVSTESSTALTITTRLSMYQLSGIEVRRTDKIRFLLTAAWTQSSAVLPESVSSSQTEVRELLANQVCFACGVGL